MTKTEKPMTRKEVQKELSKPLPTTQPERSQAINQKAGAMNKYLKDNPEG